MKKSLKSTLALLFSLLMLFSTVSILGLANASAETDGIVTIDSSINLDDTSQESLKIIGLNKTYPLGNVDVVWSKLTNANKYKIVYKCESNGKTDTATIDTESVYITLACSKVGTYSGTVTAYDSKESKLSSVDFSFEVYAQTEYSDLGDDFYAYITSVMDNKLNVYNTADAHNVKLTTSNSNSNQKQIWHFVKVMKDGTPAYKVINNYTGLYLTSDGKTTGKNVKTDVKDKLHYFYLKETSGGYKIIFRTATNYCLDIEGTNDNANANIQVWEINNSKTQVFKINKCKVTVAYHSNGADNNSGTKIDPAKDIKAKTNSYGYDVPYWYGLLNYHDTTNDFYLLRTGYAPLKYYTDKSGKIVIKQNTPFSGKELASLFGKDLSKGSVTIDIYPTWKATTYTIKYDANGGTGAPASQTKAYGETIKLSSTVPTRSGLYFIGWATSNTATTATYSAGDSYTANKSVTLYAVWSTSPKTYTVKFDANGGSGAPASQTKTEGQSLTLSSTKPTRSGYTFLGWATSKTAKSATYLAGGTYTKNESVTLYAVWSKNAAFSKSNRYAFSNSYNNFVTTWSDGKYYMSDSDYNKLIDYVSKYYSNPKSIISEINSIKNDDWSGSCYGMAATAILDYQNKIAFNENFATNASTMHDVKSPATSKKIMSAINYYHVSQEIVFIRENFYQKGYSSWSTGLKKLVERANTGEPFLFTYWWNEGNKTYGHAIVALNCKTSADGSFAIKAYDNRYPDDDVTIKVDSKYKTCKVTTPYGDENSIYMEFYSDMNKFDYIDIDGPNNDMKIKYSSYSYNNNNDIISIVADGNKTITNNNDEAITITNGTIGGTMDIVSIRMIVNSTADGNPAPATYVLEVANSDYYTFESDNNSLTASVLNNKMYGSATTENAESIIIGNDGVHVIGEKDVAYTSVLSSKDSQYDTVILEGVTSKNVSLVYAGNNIVISGADTKDKAISIYGHNESEPCVYEVKEGYENANITSSGGNVDIKSDEGKSIVTNATANAKISVASATTVDYKTSATIKATATGVPRNYYLAIYVNGKQVAKGTNTEVTYDAGQVTSDINYTVKVVDAKGNVQKDANGKDLAKDGGKITCNAGFFKKLVAFFKGLFGKLPVITIKP